jgi:hypothetical protein
LQREVGKLVPWDVEMETVERVKKGTGKSWALPGVDQQRIT